MDWKGRVLEGDATFDFGSVEVVKHWGIGRNEFFSPFLYSGKAGAIPDFPTNIAYLRGQK